MAKSRIARVSTRGIGKGYSRNPTKRPKVGGPGKTRTPKKA